MNDMENDMVTAESGTVALLNKSEIDMQIATAHKYPRSIKRFRDETLAMVTLNEKVAQECIYSLPRREKDQATGQWVVKAIEGPSARFAEVVASAWGNSRAGSRVVSDVGDFVTAQGVFHDLERNVAITYEVQRRITTSNGIRFKPDMIGVTANAACSIALRNAILKGVPKAFWSDMYDQARETAIGNVQTLANRRSRALAVLQKMGVQPQTVFDFLRISGQEDITLEHLGTLFGITTALKEGDTTPEQAFAVLNDGDAAGKPRVNMPQAKGATPPPPPPATPAQPPAAQDTEQASPPATEPPAQPRRVQPAAEGETQALASEGERKLVINRARSNELVLDDLLRQAGLDDMVGSTDLAGLTKDGFLALRDALPKAA